MAHEIYTIDETEPYQNFLVGNASPIEDKAALTLSFDSAIVLSASPTMVKAGIPGDICTCTSISVISIPLNVRLAIMNYHLLIVILLVGKAYYRTNFTKSRLVSIFDN